MMGKRNRAHTLVAHHQVCETLKENKSTVSREQGIMGSCVTLTRRHLFQSRCRCYLRSVGKGKSGTGRKRRTHGQGWHNEHLVNQSRLQCIISLLLVFIQKSKFRLTFLFIKKRSTQTVIPPTNERAIPLHTYSRRLFYLKPPTTVNSESYCHAKKKEADWSWSGFFYVN